MPKSAQVADRFRLWVFGRSIDFHPISTTMNLTPADYQHAAGVPVRRPKRQLTLHCTAGRGSAEQVIAWWNNPVSGAAAAPIVVERTSTAQAPRPAGAGAELRDDRSLLDQGRADRPLVDAVRVMDEDCVVYHGGDVNRNSIGIEIVNAGSGWYIPTLADEPSLGGRHTPLATCPAPINVGTAAVPNWVCNHARPQDLNRYIRERTHLNADFQAFQDERERERAGDRRAGALAQGDGFGDRFRERRAAAHVSAQFERNRIHCEAV